MKTNLFDGKFQVMDVIKIALLIVTAFSTWRVLTIVSTPGQFEFVRNIAALIIVEGSFLAWEAATNKAKNRKQAQIATIGFFTSICVIGLFALTAGFLQVAGDSVTSTIVSHRFGVEWSVGVLVSTTALFIIVLWIVTLASLYRVYALNDPDLAFEMAKRLNDGAVTETVIHTTRAALEDAKAPIAVGRAISALRTSFIDDMSASELDEMLRGVRVTLEKKYGLRGTKRELPAPADEVPQVTIPFTKRIDQQLEPSHNGNGRNGKTTA